ncbi:hypothetical protein [Vibrio marisflavi]|uniref:Uncharacterized protein n=1 Tax=Vibrio marisflavi CECT 7928 TaxID=634439 RepID=A0ABM9A9U2_9VIBR|nr:hypothetical protein [Vibrio marisflavi]CAH0543005.1 hypothetical protein VMF7928_04356 [Vibrio marisflavi CECT 7928]
MSSIPRLSDQNISDPILRAHYYKIVNDYINSTSSELVTYIIQMSEEYRPDLVSYRVFGSKDLAWLVCLASDLDDTADPLPVGETIYMPTAAWIRRSMRQFLTDMGLA